MNKTIIAATGIPDADEALGRISGYEVLTTIDSRMLLARMVPLTPADIVVVSERLAGEENLFEIIMQVTGTGSRPRFIFLAGALDTKDRERQLLLGMLVSAGIYDIYHEDTLSLEVLKYLLDNPKTKAEMKYLLFNVEDTSDRGGNITMQAVPVTEPEALVNNKLAVLSSIKPGTGKSFVAINTALALARYGRAGGGRPLKIALVEADLQNLSIGTLLGVENEKRNLKSAINAAKLVVEELSGRENAADPNLVAEVRENIKSCFLPYPEIPNLHVLSGSNLTIGEVARTRPEDYRYIMETVYDLYDYFIVDSNSSLYHTTTKVMLEMATRAFYILDLDFNNIKNNGRYFRDLETLGIIKKVKWILNKEVPGADVTAGDVEKWLGIKLFSSIPKLDDVTMINATFRAAPIIFNTTPETAEARRQLLHIADSLHPLNRAETSAPKGLFSRFFTGKGAAVGV